MALTTWTRSRGRRTRAAQPIVLDRQRPTPGLTSFTAVCPLRPDVDSDRARELLSRLPVGEHSPFHASPRTHFGRIQVLDEVMTDRRRPLAAPVVIVSADVDGGAREYLVELLGGAGAVLAPVLGLCHRAPSDCAAPDFVDAATDYLLDHQLAIGLQYANSPGRTASEVRLAVQRHRRLAGFALGHQDDSPAELREAFRRAFAPSPGAGR